MPFLFCLFLSLFLGKLFFLWVTAGLVDVWLVRLVAYCGGTEGWRLLRVATEG